MNNIEPAKAFLKSLTKLMKKHNVSIHVTGYEGETLYMSIGDEDFDLTDDEWKLTSDLCEKALTRLENKQ